jgi:hypothetical protein
MDEERVLLEALEEIKKRGFFDHNSPWELFDMEIETWDDYEDLLHEDIPSEIREICKRIGATASIYHLRDDVGMPEYIILIERDGEEYTLMLGLSEDFCDDDEGPALYTILITDGLRGWVEPPIYYHPV